MFLVGVGGGVPHYTDYARHVRLGDVVVSSPAPDLPDKSVFIISFFIIFSLYLDEMYSV